LHAPVAAVPEPLSRVRGALALVVFAFLALFAASPAFADCAYLNETIGSVASDARYGDSSAADCSDSNLASSSNNTLVVGAPSATFTSSNFYGAVGANGYQGSATTAAAAAANNNITIFNGLIGGDATVFGGSGGYGSGGSNGIGSGGTANNNIVIFNGLIVDGWTDSQNVVHRGSVFGGRGGGGGGAGAGASSNAVIFNGSITGGSVFGGYGGSGGGWGSTPGSAAGNNIVIINGPTTKSTVYGGVAGSANTSWGGGWLCREQQYRHFQRFVHHRHCLRWIRRHGS
jgi:hypothetical protein